MSERKEFPTHIEGIPVAQRSFIDKAKKGIVKAGDNLNKQVDFGFFPSDVIGGLEDDYWMSHTSVKAVDKDLNYIGLQVENHGINPPSLLAVKDSNGQEYSGTFWSGQYLKQFFQADLSREGIYPFDILTLDFPLNLMSRDDIYCLFVPCGFECRNPEILEKAKELVMADKNIHADIKREIIDSNDALRLCILRDAPHFYNSSDWNLEEYFPILFKFTELGLAEKEVGSEDWEDEVVLKTEMVAGDRGRLHIDPFHSNKHLQILAKIWNSHLRLYHLQKGSSETETKRKSKGLKLSPNSI